MTSVRETWALQCPRCSRDDKLHVVAVTQAHLLPDGSEDVEGPEWSSDSTGWCTACEFQGVVLDFAIDRLPQMEADE